MPVFYNDTKYFPTNTAIEILTDIQMWKLKLPER